MIRRRRTPEQAREEILDAAAELIARHGPDGVSLRRVAEAAGVTHGLVTHYFGTYRALAQAVLHRENERHRRRVRDRMGADDGVPYATAMTTVLFDTLSDERYVRLWTWSQLHVGDLGTASTDLADLVDAVEHGIRQVLPEPLAPDRARIEAVVLLLLSSAYGFALGRRAWLAGLGHDPDDPAHGEHFRAVVSSALAAHLGRR